MNKIVDFRAPIVAAGTPAGGLGPGSGPGERLLALNESDGDQFGHDKPAVSCAVFTHRQMSPARARLETQPAAARRVARLGLAIGTRLRDERTSRRWTVRALADRARLSPAAVCAAELGRPASMDTYLRLCDALGLTLEVELLDRRRSPRPARSADSVHAAMGELEVMRLTELGFRTGVDEPYQHYQFAGRADVVAWDVTARALLHIENRTRFPDLQEAAGAWNAKRSYLPAALAARLGVRGGWRSVSHVLVALWSAEVLHVLRLRSATFSALCPDPPDAFTAWWSGTPPPTGESSTMLVLDPAPGGRQRTFCSLERALRAKPRYRGYADAADKLRSATSGVRAGFLR